MKGLAEVDFFLVLRYVWQYVNTCYLWLVSLHLAIQPYDTIFLLDEVFSGYQLGKVVQFFRDQRFEDHLCPHPQGS
jgi:hypothetical protein